MTTPTNDNVGKCGHAKCAGGNGCYMKGQPMQPYQKDVPIKSRLEELRAVLRSESISYGELHELASLKAYIEDDDVELLEPAGVPDGDCGVCGVYRCREDHDVQE